VALAAGSDGLSSQPGRWHRRRRRWSRARYPSHESAVTEVIVNAVRYQQGVGDGGENRGRRRTEYRCCNTGRGVCRCPSSSFFLVSTHSTGLPLGLWPGAAGVDWRNCWSRSWHPPSGDEFLTQRAAAIAGLLQELRGGVGG